MLPDTRPAFSAATDLWIAIRVAWAPKHLAAFGIYRRLSPPSGIFSGRYDGKFVVRWKKI